MRGDWALKPRAVILKPHESLRKKTNKKQQNKTNNKQTNKTKQSVLRLVYLRAVRFFNQKIPLRTRRKWFGVERSVCRGASVVIYSKVLSRKNVNKTIVARPIA